MWWWFGQWQLIRAMSWQVIIVKVTKYVSVVSTLSMGYATAGHMIHAAGHPGSVDVARTLLSARGTIVSLIVAVLSIYIDRKSSKYGKLRSERIIDKQDFKDIYGALDQESRQRGCRVDEFDGMAGWTNPALNKRLLLGCGPKGARLAYQANASPWLAYKSQDPGQKSSGAILRRYVIREALKQKRVIFNSRKIRLCADIDVELGEKVQLQRTDYISSMMTDGLAFQNIYLKADHITISDGWSSFLEQVNGRWRLKPLASCRSSNQLGASTLAFSSDGFLVLIDQTERNQHSAEMISPSGSGSFDWSDLDDHLDGDFIQLVKRAAAREVVEEIGLGTLPDFDRESFVQKSMIILGFTRLVHRGGKPEFFCLARLPKTMEEIRSVTPQFFEGWYSEQAFSHDASAIDLKGDLVAEIRRVCRHYSDATRIFSDPEKIRRYRLSYQLMHGLALLEECLSDADSVAALKAVFGAT
jgi:hypothetical protein